MIEYYMVVANVEQPDPKDGRFALNRNWDIKEFEEYPKPEQIEQALNSTNFGSVGVQQHIIRYAKVEKRYRFE